MCVRCARRLLVFDFVDCDSGGGFADAVFYLFVMMFVFVIMLDIEVLVD